MLQLTFKNLLARKLRLVTTGIAVFIGVAFMAGTMVLTDTVTATFDSLFRDVNAGIDVQVRKASSVEAGGMEVRGRVEDDLISTISAVDGVGNAVGFIQGFTQITGTDGEPVGNPGQGAPTFGMSWVDDPDLNPFTLAEGRAPRADNEIVIDRGSAKEGSIELGDTIDVDAAKPAPKMTVVGIAVFGNADSPLGASVTLYTPTAAQAYVGEPGMVDVIGVRAADGVSDEVLRSRIEAVLTDDYEAQTGAEVTEENQNQMASNLSFFSTFMLTFALIALFVGSFIIYNTFSILVAQRMREVALLRAVGASRRQVVGSVIVESIAVGLIAAVLGIAGGIGVAGLLKGLLAAVGFDIPAGGLVLTPGTVIVSLLVGVAVTVAAAIMPARRAARVAPVDALSGNAAEIDDHLGKRIAIGAVVTAAGAALGFFGLFGDTSQAGPLVGLGGVLMFVGIAILGPVVARPVASILGRPLPAIRGVAGTIARENAMRNPRRTSATAAALMIGVALVGFITIFASSAKAAIRDIIGEQFVGDFVVQSGTWGFGGLEPGVAERIAGLPEVEAASGFRFGPAAVDGEGVATGSVDPVAYAKVINLEVRAGSIESLGTDGFAVDQSVADEKGWKVGDVVPVTFAASGEQPLELRAIYEVDEIGPEVMFSTALHDANYTEKFDAEVYVKVASGVSTADAERAIAAAIGDQANADIVDREGYINAQASDINQMLSLIYALLGLAIVIAVLGIANTLALSIHERTRELGVLRAVGMTRSQLRTSVRWESVIIAMFGTTVGLAIGVAFGWAMVQALKDEGFDTLVIPIGPLAIVTMLAAACGVIAAIRPARRAAKLDVLAAIATT